MKLSSFLAIACAIIPVFGNTLPVPAVVIEERGAGNEHIFTHALHKVTADVKKLQSAFRKIKGDKVSRTVTKEIFSDGKILGDQLETSICKIEKAKKLSTKEASHVQKTALKLVSAVRSTSKTIISKKTPIDNSKFNLTLISGVEKQFNSLADAIIAKLNEKDVYAAEKDKASIDSSLQSVLKALKA